MIDPEKKPLDGASGSSPKWSGSKVTRHPHRLQQTAHTLSGIVEAVSEFWRTLRGLKDLPQLFHPREFDADGYSKVAELSIDDARMLHRAFRYFDGPQAKGGGLI